MTISYQMFSLEKKYLTKDFLAFGVLPFFILYSAFMIISTTCIPSASAFMNQNLLGLYSPNNPVPIVPTNPSMNSFYGGGYGCMAGDMVWWWWCIGQSFGTGLVGLLPQVLGLGTGYGGIWVWWWWWSWPEFWHRIGWIVATSFRRHRLVVWSGFKVGL